MPSSWAASRPNSSACAEPVIAHLEKAFAARGYDVVRNRPSAGGFSTRHYGAPARGLHAVQIEINRALYMDEARIEPNGGMDKLKQDLTALIQSLATIDISMLRAA